MKYKINIVAGQSQMITTLSVPAENIIIQSIWFKTASNDWIYALGHDDIKCKISVESDRLYFYCFKLHARYTGDCMIVVQIIKNI